MSKIVVVLLMTPPAWIKQEGGNVGKVQDDPKVSNTSLSSMELSER